MIIQTDKILYGERLGAGEGRKSRCTHSLARALWRKDGAGREGWCSTRDYSLGMHAMENKGWCARWQYLFRKTIPRRLKWNLKLSAPQSGVKPPATTQHIGAARKNGAAARKMMIVMLLPAKEESQPGKCNGRLKKQSQYNTRSRHTTPCLVLFLLFAGNARRLVIIVGAEGVFPSSCSRQMASGTWLSIDYV
jgi:hypothetical protein